MDSELRTAIVIHIVDVACKAALNTNGGFQEGDNETDLHDCVFGILSTDRELASLVECTMAELVPLIDQALVPWNERARAFFAGDLE